MNFRILMLIFISGGGLWALASAGRADPIDCNDLSALLCKNKFGVEYERSFKKIYIDGVNEFFRAFKTIAEKIIMKLPANNTVAERLRNRLTMLNKDIDELNANVNDNTKVVDTIARIMNTVDYHSTMTTADTDISSQDLEEYGKLNERREMIDLLHEGLFKMIFDVAQLYTDMYAGLRDIDLKEFAEYSELNGIMEKLQSSDRDPRNVQLYIRARECFANKFHLPYFIAVSEKIRASKQS